jgi:hypothetical protein
LSRYGRLVTGLEFALWGAAGSFAVEGLELTIDVKRLGRWPWGTPGFPSAAASSAALAIRLVIGALVAAVSGLGGQVSGAFGAFAAGIAAPLIIEKLGKTVVASGQSRQEVIATATTNPPLTENGGEA